MSQYEALRRLLDADPSPNVTMTFQQIEDLLGRRLPPSARGVHSRQWWANSDSHTQAKAWLMAGRKAKLAPRDQAVAFVRQAGPTTGHGRAEEELRAPLIALNAAARRAVEDLAEEKALTLSQAAVALLNNHALERRKASLEWFARNTKASNITSAELIRTDRDGR